MRVIVNQIAGLGQKTGIGHYTTELLRCMREQVAGDEIDDYPKGWLRRAGRAFKRARPYLEGQESGVRNQESGVRTSDLRSLIPDS